MRATPRATVCIGLPKLLISVKRWVIVWERLASDPYLAGCEERGLDHVMVRSVSFGVDHHAGEILPSSHSHARSSFPGLLGPEPDRETMR